MQADMQIVEIMNQALLCFAEGDLVQAEKLFLQIQQTHPDLVLVPIHLAQIAQLKGQAKDWIVTLENLLQQKPYLAQAAYVLAQCYQQVGKLPQAVALFYQAITLEFLQDGFFKPQAAKTLQSQDSQNNALALQTLWQTLALLKTAGIAAFATSGTLLGLERTGHLLAHDKDVDIGLDWLQMSEAVSLLKKHGWTEQQRSYDLINPRCLKSSAGIMVDLCGYATDQATGETLAGLWMDKIPFDWNRITCYPKIELTAKQSPAGTIWHLKNPQDFLQALYGPDWQTEDTHFDTIISAHNLRGFAWLTQCYALARLYTRLKQNQYPKALSILQVLLKHQPKDAILQKLQQTVLQHSQTQPAPNATASRVLALGCFDLIHPGHANYLAYAKQQGSTLVVGVAPDAFCLKSKGQAPLMSEQQRQQMVASLKWVDEVHLVAFPMAQTQAAADWIASLTVQKVICGQEWQNTERWQKLTLALEQHGIQVEYAPMTPDISTSQLKQQAVLNKQKIA